MNTLRFSSVQIKGLREKMFTLNSGDVFFFRPERKKRKESHCSQTNSQEVTVVISHTSNALLSPLPCPCDEINSTPTLPSLNATSQEAIPIAN